MLIIIRLRKKVNTLLDNKIINKTMELSDFKSDQSREIIAELGDLIKNLQGRGLKISSWAGYFELTGAKNSNEVLNRGFNYKPLEEAVDDINFPWFLYWEIVWVVINASFQKGQKVLDMGGSSSLFSYYLASKGLNVTTIDMQRNLVENANLVAQEMKWQLTNYVMDMREIKFKTMFDHITSICVFEHIPMYERIEINKEISKLLVPGGRFSITFDYRNPSGLAKINSPSDVDEQFVKPSGLNLRGNANFHDTEQNYLLHPFFHPKASLKYKFWNVRHGHFGIREFLKTKQDNDYTFGALFQKKN
ncbi:class I SAM-dependent methyltransferase [candidate division KSB1 bacterium]|nr:class I SAM-dependent methyltransferase [candidate division KSB1 bacterium]